MTPTIEADEFSPSDLPTYLKKESRDTISVAVMLGWTLHISSSKSVTIISPGEKKKYHFSSSGRTSTGINRIRKDIVRYSDPEKLQIAVDSTSIMDKNKDLAAVAMGMLPNLGDKGTVVDHRPELEAEAEAKRQEREQRRAERGAGGVAGDPKGPDFVPGPAMSTGPDSSSESERHIVKQEPMLAKASKGRGYESQVAIERTWSDGTTDYKCVDCDYTSDKRLSIRSHRTKSDHTARGSERINARRAEVPNAVTYRPRQPRIEALAEVLKVLMEGGVDTPEELARRALTWVHEQSNKGTSMAAEHEPMTAEQTLDRIRMLLDDGQQAKIVEQAGEIERLNAESEKLRERVEELESFVELAEALRRRVE